MKLDHRTRRGLRIALAVALSLLLIFLGLGTHAAYQEMRHEGLTYSQWYEGAIRGFFAVLLPTLACAGLCIGAWARAIGAGRLRAQSPGVRWGLKYLLSASAALTGLFVVLSLLDVRAIQSAEAGFLAPSIQACGVHLSCGLVALEAWIAAIAGLRRGKRSDGQAASKRKDAER